VLKSQIIVCDILSWRLCFFSLSSRHVSGSDPVSRCCYCPGCQTGEWPRHEYGPLC